MNTLRNKLIRLAHEKPELREKLLPLITEGQTKVAEAGPFYGARGGKWADKEHTIPWHDKKHSGKPAPKAKPHDDHESNNLQLISEHNARPHSGGRYPHHDSEEAGEHRLHASKEHIKANLIKHVAKGTYCHAQATKAFAHHVKAVSDHAKKHNLGGGESPATRNHAAKQMADEFHEELKSGEHDDHHVLTGVHKKRAEAGGGISAMAKSHGKKKTNTKKKAGTYQEYRSKSKARPPLTKEQWEKKQDQLKGMSHSQLQQHHDEHKGKAGIPDHRDFSSINEHLHHSDHAMITKDHMDARGEKK